MKKKQQNKKPPKPKTGFGKKTAKTGALEKVVKKKKAKKALELKVKEFSAELPQDKAGALKSLAVVLHPLITEKSIGMIEAENKLVFVVDRNATKASVRQAVENLYKIKVDGVNILLDLKGRKRAFVKINKQFRADEIATKLGVL
ncbi:MAG: 50S ribosomal protein L23 [Candidatus Diapherotrites archaeon]|nr:50S ribosomal protein L23 [Candidatus Diapherotrites archaeon]